MSLFGITSATTTITMPRYIGVTAYPATMALSISLSTAFGQLGNYASSYWMKFCYFVFNKAASGYVASLYMLILIGSIACAISIVKDLRPNELRKKEEK